MLVALNKHSFIRRYESIGYVYSQLSRRDMVFDTVGSEFLSRIERSPVHIDRIIKQLARTFPDANVCELENDFVDFVRTLEEEGFVTTGGEGEDLLSKEVKNLQSIHQAKDVQISKIRDSRDCLNAHFKNYPRPFRAYIELTTKCNLKCVHCYIPPNGTRYMLSKEIVCAFLDQLESMGTLEVIFTGGEALLQKDLIHILSYARERDFSLLLLSNGTLFTDSLIDALKQMDLSLIQISLYSMDPAIHDRITGVAGSWLKTKHSIDTLVNNDCHVEIACPIIRENADSFHGVTEYANTIGVGVNNDLGIMAKDDFSTDNLEHRVDADKIHDILAWKKRFEMSTEMDVQTSRKFRMNEPVCGMGLSLICLSSNGDYYPCPGFRMRLGSIHENTLRDAWDNSASINSLREVTNASFEKCMKCESLDYCTICPAKFYNESDGDMFKANEYYCKIARANKSLSGRA